MELSKDGYRMSYVPLNGDGAGYSGSSRPRPLSSAEQVFLQSQTRGFWGASWTLEILSCLTSIAFFVAIIVVLSHFDGRPMPDWPYGITLNALVSVFSTVMKATMAFILTESLAQLKWSWFRGGNKLSDLALLDAASRGAAGAFVVLFRFLPRHLVTFGCFVLVVAAATDPFVQQVMTIKIRPVHASGRSSIQVCNASLYTDYGEGAGPGMNKVPLGTTGAIYSGIFQNQSPNSKSVTMSCSTGNCTFAPYQSLGFCSRCANITDSIKLSKSSSSMTGTYNYKLPNGLEFNTMSGMPYLMNSTTGLDLLKLNTDNMALILNFTAISSPGIGIPPAPSATECALFFCVDTYEAAVRDGSYSETRTAIAASSNVSSQSSISQDFALTPETCYFNGTTYQKPHKHPEYCTYNVNWLSRVAMANSVGPLLKGYGSLFGGYRPDWSSDSIEAAYGVEGNYNDIASMFSSLASSLTVNARSKICDATVNGTAWTVVSFVHVRWLWLILPAALVALSGVFLVITILHTQNQYIWKSSPLALLFSDLAIDDPMPMRSDPTLKGMEDTSRRMEVLLETSHEGVKLKAIPRS
ncbi:hypothetical protein N7462_011228 [Penicillium macrosclerotiorum]|uniref:uncharacterized protein n=1 Tax=Penicillium macrosclerotiorum TaxID=303699 RepID=UPI002546CB7F|nr:uncharacterized protein N7462_011228 [Penicillium macrosclerotiorum]KAJ5666819.1 hypothetical protein N7462_011228 [Penicillium macrosclerotiorum]